MSLCTRGAGGPEAPALRTEIDEAMSGTVMKALAVAGTVTLAAAALAPTAEAGPRYRCCYGGNAAAAAIVGLGVGALIGGALASERYYYAPPPPDYVYVPAQYGPPPWTPEWYAYCHSKYVSFDPRSGTYLGYDGLRHFCR